MLKNPRSAIATGISVAALAVALIGNGVVYKIANDQQITAANAKTAICSLRSNILQDQAETRKEIEQTKDFIAENPAGAFGFTPSELNQALADKQARLINQQENYAALSVARC